MFRRRTHLFSLIIAALTGSLAAPTVPRAQEINCARLPAETCDPTRYTIEWFLNCPKYQRQQLLTDRALFYSHGAGHYAKKLRLASGGFYVTIWDIWEEWIYIDSTSSANPLHCIHNNPALQRQYYQTMSAAFARMARGSATVMHLNQNLQNPPTHGIWGSIELPQLRTSTDVDQLWTVDQNGALYTGINLDKHQELMRMQQAQKIMWETSKRSRMAERATVAPGQVGGQVGKSRLDDVEEKDVDDIRLRWWAEGGSLDELM